MLIQILLSKNVLQRNAECFNTADKQLILFKLDIICILNFLDRKLHKTNSILKTNLKGYSAADSAALSFCRSIEMKIQLFARLTVSWLVQSF